MQNEQIAAAVNKLIVEKLDLNPAVSYQKASIANDLGIDSLDLCDVITAAEKKFLIPIPDEVVNKLVTIGDLTAYITAHTVAAR